MATSSHRNALKPGYRVHWYQIEKILGQGGFGITYLADDTNLNQKVAVKEYLPVEVAFREGDYSVHPVSENHSESYQWGLERFLEEARTLARFDHPNIVRVLSVFEMNNTAYMVMRYESGHSFQQMLPKRATLDEERLAEILFPVLDGLRLVHEAGFIHRDVKPANIFVRGDGSPVLLDFGSARQSLGEATRTLTTLVSPGYAPFEQYYSKSDKQGPWTDIYGLGATLYRAVVGVPPMNAVDRSEGIIKKSQDPLVPAAQAAVGRYSKQFLDAIDWSLRFDETARPQSIDEWKRGFEGTEIPAPAGDHLPSDAPTLVAGEAETALADVDLPLQATTPLRGEETATVDTAATPATEPIASPQTGGAVEALYRCFVGTKGSPYYAERFQRFDERARKWPLSWNWPGALLSVCWFSYRRMYLWGLVLYPLITLAATFLLLAPVSGLAFGGGDVPARVGLPVLLLVAFVWPGALANAIYYRRAKSNIARMHGLAVEDDAARHAWLAGRGGTSRVAAGIAFSALTALALVIAGAQTKKMQKPQPTAKSQPQAPSAPSGERPSAAKTQPSIEAGPKAQRQPEPQAESPGESASPTEEAQPSEEQRIARLLDGAQEDIDGLRLSTPRGDNALEKYREVLSMDPDNATAKRGVRKIVGAYVELGKQAAKRKDYDRAQSYLDQALSIAPRSRELRKARDRLEKARRRAR
jgi:serine/threonine protein kinase/tetratricopeptide (TPR) repeat protein